MPAMARRAPAYWAEVESSGAPHAEIAVKHRLSLSALKYHIHKSRKSERAPAGRPRLLPVRFAGEPMMLQAQVGAVRLSFSEGCSPSYVAALLTALSKPRADTTGERSNLHFCRPRRSAPRPRWLERDRSRPVGDGPLRHLFVFSAAVVTAARSCSGIEAGWCFTTRGRGQGCRHHRQREPPCSAAKQVQADLHTAPSLGPHTAWTLRATLRARTRHPIRAQELPRAWMLPASRFHPVGQQHRRSLAARCGNWGA
jgi:hypothetical protein